LSEKVAFVARMSSKRHAKEAEDDRKRSGENNRKE
jgi:hypothetical protein